MNIFKNPVFWMAVGTAGFYITFGPLLLTMAGVLDNDIARFITLYIGAPIFIPSVIAMKITSRLATPKP